MKLEVGRTYRARNGELWKVVNKYTSSRYPFIAMTLDESEENCYTENGQSLIDVNSLRDLVIEVGGDDHRDLVALWKDDK